MRAADSMSCEITASFLDSGRVLGNAANAAAVVAGVGCFWAGWLLVRVVLGASLLFWFLECYFAVRVSIDASLFRVMAADVEAVGERLDESLGRPARSLEDRTRGALNLWRKQRAMLAVQLATLFTGIVLRMAGH